MVQASSLHLEMRGISKNFPGVQALSNVSLHLFPGECLGIIGENGAGKSTLIKILGGVHSPTAGEILIDGLPVTIDTPADATDLGIRIIHQELNLCDNLDVTSNIFLGRETCTGGPVRLLDRKRMRQSARALLDRVGLQVPTSTVVGALSTGMRQLVEIAKALAVEARILVMDEPTSALSQSEAERLFEIIRRLNEEGVSILYISHRMPEILRLTNRVLCLRDGLAVGEVATDQTNHDELVRLMIGRDLADVFEKDNHPANTVTLEARSIRFTGLPNTFSFQIHRGEILGLAGLVGAGRTELASALFGLPPIAAGQVSIEGRPVRIRSPRDAIRLGLSMVPEDRRRYGLVLPQTVAENLVLGVQGRDGPARLKRAKPIEQMAHELIGRMRIKTPSPETVAMNLSGGNQQKIVLGKWLAVEPKVLILDEPTRGIDVAAKQEIYRIICDLAKAGLAILMISSEMEEILGLSDRVMVMHEGHIVGTVERSEMDEEKIMRMASGLDP